MGGLCYNVRDGVFVGGLITSSGLIYAALVNELVKKSRAETGESTFKSSGLAGCSNAG